MSWISSILITSFSELQTWLAWGAGLGKSLKQTALPSDPSLRWNNSQSWETCRESWGSDPASLTSFSEWKFCLLFPSDEGQNDTSEQVTKLKMTYSCPDLTRCCVNREIKHNVFCSAHVSSIWGALQWLNTCESSLWWEGKTYKDRWHHLKTERSEGRGLRRHFNHIKAVYHCT